MPTQKIAIPILVLIAIAGPAISDSVRVARDPEPVSYNRDIRPILSDNCFYCHGPDPKHRDGKYRLDIRESALKKKAIVPGKPEDSSLITRIHTADADDVMPPTKTHKKLSDAQKQLLRRWIAEGAVYEQHWSYTTLQSPAVPTLGSPWVANPIDAFILQKLQSRNLKPSAEADKRTLLRRLSLDLAGLPPTPQEMQAFLDDKTPDAYARQVDRLLASPHFGERMAVPWLDAVRFADTVGFHGDQNVNVFPYRDYVINAFNTNKPFNQFTLEQIAGDLLPKATEEQRIASAYNRLNMVTREGGAQPKEYLAKYTADRVRTFSNAFLGSTMGCSECHDHKYDPFTTRDFYSLGAFWADVKQWGVYADYRYTPEPELAGVDNDWPFPPEITVDSLYLHQRIRKLSAKIDGLVSAAAAPLKQDAKQREAFGQWRRQTLAFLKSNPGGWATATPKTAPLQTPAPESTDKAKPKEPAKPAEQLPNADGSIALLTKTSARLEFKLKPGAIAAIRIEVLPHEKHGGKITRGGDASIDFSATLKPKTGGENKLALFHADADHKKDRYENGYALIGVTKTWMISASAPTAPQMAVWILQSSVTAQEGDELVITLGKNPPGCVRVSTSPIAPTDPIDTALPAALLGALEKDAGNAAAAEDVLAQRSYLLSTGWDGATLESARQVMRDIYECRNGKSPVVVTQAWPPRVMRVLPRGNWKDEGGEVVVPAVPHFLPQPSNPDGRRLTRLDLAQWVVSPENPLTARVFVNRLWKQFLGAGLCNSLEDVGAQGEYPSHPALLDWLATEFRDNNWDIKRIVRLLVMSSTYRQDSRLRRELVDIDPANRLLASQSPRRLEAEFVRDNALAVAGLINLDVGGPSAFPYQPPGYYVNLQFPDRDYRASADDRQYRRGLYSHWQRTFLHPMLANFDAPSREDSVCTRNVSNTPQQALTLLNSPVFVEAARSLAVRALAAAKDDAPRLEFLFQNALGRSPKPAESASLTDFIGEQRRRFKAAPNEAQLLLKVGAAPIPAGADEIELAAWTSVCRVVLNLHETLTRY